MYYSTPKHLETSIPQGYSPGTTNPKSGDALGYRVPNLKTHSSLFSSLDVRCFFMGRSTFCFQCLSQQV